tara:strand:- start:377 stop:589 length:213 start_codon:yes stop_codon:yes gene_type:complete
MASKKKSFGSKMISMVNPLDPSKSTTRKVIESGLLLGDPLLRLIGMKDGGKVRGCGMAKKGFGKAMKRKK